MIAHEPPVLGPKMAAAVQELEDRILARYPGTVFQITSSPDERGAVYLRAGVDVDDLDLVTDLVIDRVMELLIEDGLPISVVAVRTPERRAQFLMPDAV